MATFINEQSDEDFGSAMFSYMSHTMGKQEERKKSDRKTGKERRKGEKTLRYGAYAEKAEKEMPSINTIWCIGRAGHWGTPMLDDCGVLIRPDYCVDCQHNDDKLIVEKRKPTYPTEDEIAWMSAMEYQLDMIELAEQRFRLDEEQRMLEKINRMRLMNLLLESLKITNEDPYDNYIPEIDDDFDF
jgi:hypothetical protein